MRFLILLVFAFPMAGCSTLSALSEATEALEIYELRPPPVETPRRTPKNIEVVIEEPVAGGSLATDRIMIRPSPLRAQYLPGIRWSDPAPTMLQTLLIRTLNDRNSFVSVGRAPLGASADYAFLSELTDFQAEVTEGDPSGARDHIVSIRLTARLIRETGARVVARRSFSVQQPARDDTDEAIVAAFDAAAQVIIDEIAEWITGQL